MSSLYVQPQQPIDCDKKRSLLKKESHFSQPGKNLYKYDNKHLNRHLTQKSLVLYNHLHNLNYNICHENPNHK